MKKLETFPSPETQLNILKRYLHVLALLQNGDETWNASNLAGILSLDEDPSDTLSDKSIREYIDDYLIKEMGLIVEKKKGAKRISLSIPLDKERMLRIAHVYTSFIINDSGRNIILKNFLRKHPEKGMWLLARIYFACKEKKKITFQYKPHSAKTWKNYLIKPYYLIFRNNNLYLVGGFEDSREILFIMNKIKNLAITNTLFDNEAQESEVLFKDSLGSYIGKTYKVKIRFDSEILGYLEQILGILEPRFKEIDNGKRFEAAFSVSDDTYLCKQLFAFGNKVEIVEPASLREMMIKLLREGLSVYK